MVQVCYMLSVGTGRHTLYRARIFARKNSHILIDNHGDFLDSSAPTYPIVGNLLEEPFEMSFAGFS